MSDRPHYPPAEPFYRQQRTDLKKFDENYQAIDWSRKRTSEPPAGWEPIGLSSLPEEVDVAAGWWAYVIHPDDLTKAWKWPGVVVDGYAPRYATQDDALAQENPIFALNEIGGPLNPLWISASYTVIFTNKLLVGDPLATQRAEQDTRSIEKETND